MTPNQLEVLRLANELGEITRFEVSRRLGISTEYGITFAGGSAERGIFHP